MEEGEKGKDRGEGSELQRKWEERLRKRWNHKRNMNKWNENR